MLAAADTDCGMPCAGNSSQTCGGPSRLSVYGNATAPPLAFKYYNCYIVASGTPAALSGAHTTDAAGMTVEACAAFCL